jgi:hypothetical protein
VIAVVQLRGVNGGCGDYKALLNHCFDARIFALRGKLGAGKSVGMGQIRGIVERLLDIFLEGDG